MPRSKRWTYDENQVIKKNFIKYGPELCEELLPHRSPRAIRHQAGLLGFLTPRRGAVLRHNHGTHEFIQPMTNAELTAYWDAQPVDDREFTARLLGDPCPGRSALEMKSGHK